LSQAPAVLSGPLHPHGHQSRLARAVLRLFGWRVESPGLPAQQGVILVYPHTSNWDFVVGVLAKWALGLQLRFWGKDSLFKVPLLGRWVRYLGGVAVDRNSRHGIVDDTVRQMREAALRTGWRTGAYQVAVQAGVPVGLCYFDFQARVVSLTRFVQLTGNVDTDFAAFADYLGHRVGKRPELASPIRPRT
jgi:hypothetical protein